MRRTIHFFILLAPSCLILLQGSSSEHTFCSSVQLIPQITQDEAMKLAHSKHNDSESLTWGFCKLEGNVGFVEVGNQFNAVKRDTLSNQFFSAARIRIRRQGKSRRTAKPIPQTNNRRVRDTQPNSHRVLRESGAHKGYFMGIRTTQNRRERHKLLLRDHHHHENRKAKREEEDKTSHKLDSTNRRSLGRLFVNRCVRSNHKNADHLEKRFTFFSENRSDRRRHERTRLLRERTKRHSEAKIWSRESLLIKEISPVYQDSRQKRLSRKILERTARFAVNHKRQQRRCSSENLVRTDSSSFYKNRKRQRLSHDRQDNRWNMKLSDQNRSIREQDNRRRLLINDRRRVTLSTRTPSQKNYLNHEVRNIANLDVRRFAAVNEHVTERHTIKDDRRSNRQNTRNLIRNMSGEERFMNHKGQGTRQMISIKLNKSTLEQQQYNNKRISRHSTISRSKRVHKDFRTNRNIESRRHVDIRHRNEWVRQGQDRRRYTKEGKRDKSANYIVKKADDRRSGIRYSNSVQQQNCINSIWGDSARQQCFGHGHSDIVNGQHRNIQLRQSSNKNLSRNMKQQSKIEPVMTWDRRKDATHGNNNYQERRKGAAYHDSNYQKRQETEPHNRVAYDTIISVMDEGIKTKWTLLSDGTSKDLLSNFTRSALTQIGKHNHIEHDGSSNLFMIGCIGLLTTGVVMKQ